MYLYNPDSGAPIKKFWVNKKIYFDTKEFEVGEVINIDDDVGAYLKEVYGFLQEVDEAKAKELHTSGKKFVCEECKKEFTAEIGLIGHKRTHVKKTVDGIPVAEGSDPQKKEVKPEAITQAAIDAEAARDGLVGDGIVHEKVKIDELAIV